MQVEQSRLSQAIAAIQESTDRMRRLQTEQCVDTVDWNDAHNIAQIVQGTAFIVLAMWLIFANNAKVAVASKAPLEQRHAVCATLSTAVCLFSGFFNILQLTGIDDFQIPGYTGGFVLQLARPVEWVLTCPILQLKLVILAGARVPSYRRFMMPLLSAAVLLCGVAATFTDGGLRYIWFGFGMILVVIMFYYNAQQISENSEGEESILHGQSDYRKLTLVLIATWFPFPIWFALSPEGFNLFDEELTIEMGWVVLNMCAKFSMIIIGQRMKLVHQRKLEAARELYGLSPSDEVPENALNQKAIMESSKGGRGNLNPEEYGLGLGEEAESEEKLVELVADTMVTLQLANHTERLLKLLVESGVTNTAVLERLNQERCMELCLPWALVDAIQRRWSNEKMNMGQDQGGVVEKEDPFMKVLEANKERITSMKSGSQVTGVVTPPLGGVVDMSSFNDQIVAAVQRAVLPLHETVMSKLQTFEESVNHSLESTQESVAQRMDFGQVTLMQTVNACQVLLHKLDSSQEVVLQKLDMQRKDLEQMRTSYESLQGNIAGAQDVTRSALVETVSTSSSALLQKLDSTQQDLLRKTVESQSILQTVASTQNTMVTKMETGNDTTVRRLMEIETSLGKKMTELGDTVTSSYTVSSESVMATLKDELTALHDQSSSTVVATERSTAILDERMTDVRRQNLMIMDLLTNANDGIQTNADSLQAIRGLDTSTADQLRGIMAEELTKAQGNDAGSFRTAVETMVERLEENAARLEKHSSGRSAESIKKELAQIEERLTNHQTQVIEEVMREVKDTQLGLQTQLTDFTTRFESSAVTKTEKAPTGSTPLTPPEKPSSSPSQRRSSARNVERG
ncbi:hop [Symbiodinium sp. CCMP2456]|nr:hop [Symbiodinium sp. CCMP2456]